MAATPLPPTDDRPVLHRVTEPARMDLRAPVLTGLAAWTVALLGGLARDAAPLWTATCTAGLVLGLAGLAWAAIMDRRHARSQKVGRPTDPPAPSPSSSKSPGSMNGAGSG